MKARFFRFATVFAAETAVVACLFLFAPPSVSAANLYFSPSSGNYGTGQTFTVSIYAGSTDQSMNAISGVVVFPSDKLSVVSLSKSASIVSLWVQEPSFSNGAGTVNFEGIVLNPGYTGSAGKIITIAFKTKQAGNAALSFTSSSLLANDGKGTNILSGIGTANFSIGITPKESTTSTVSSGAPQAPKITSPTHPDPGQWYSKSDATFEWTVPQDATRVRVLYDKFPYSQPTVAYNASLVKKDITSAADGIWYFHAQFTNSNGSGAISHFRFQIDTEKPDSFIIEEIPRSDPTDPVAQFTLTAMDKLSGIDHFEIKIDDGLNPAVTWNGQSGATYRTKPIPPGKHTISAKAVDKAGNYAADFVDFFIQPLLETPVITDIEKEIPEGEIVSLRGNTKYRNDGDTVLVRIERGGRPTIVQTVRIIDDQGDFTFVLDQKLNRGAYNVSLRAVDSRGAQSEESPKSNFAVVSSGSLNIGNIVVSYLSLFLLSIIIISIIAFIGLYIWHKFTWFNKRLKNETNEEQMAVMRAFATLRDEIKGQIAMMDGRGDLSEQEKKIYHKFREALRISEKYIARKVKDIDKK